jgi:hypothetical protein
MHRRDRESGGHEAPRRHLQTLHCRRSLDYLHLQLERRARNREVHPAPALLDDERYESIAATSDLDSEARRHSRTLAQAIA